MKLIIKKFTVTSPDSKEDVPYFFTIYDEESGETLYKFSTLDDATNKKNELENINKDSE